MDPKPEQTESGKAAEIVEKIRKLLALAKDNPNEGERETALAIAHRLMLEYGVDARAVETASTSRCGDGYVERETDVKSKTITMFHRAAAAITGRYFFVQIVFMRRMTAEGVEVAVRLFGRPEHVAIGIYVFEFVFREFRERCRAFARDPESKTRDRIRHDPWTGKPIAPGRPDVRAFLMGLEMGLCEKLRAAEVRATAPRPGSSPNGLVLLRNGLTIAAANYYPKLRDLPPPKAKPVEALQFGDLLSGLNQGRSIEILKPIRGTSPETGVSRGE
ncbi:MAG: DUF2786 domain-containing protein [Planctomycetota bacterium]|nr:DUF2786 domain-containing protein [Planctomycetota bacterium]